MYRNAQEMFDDAKFVVMVNRSESHFLWLLYSKESPFEYDIKADTYVSPKEGFLVCVNAGVEKETYIAISMAVINGANVLYVEDTSTYVDNAAIADYLKEHCNAYRKGARCVAIDFEDCLNSFNEKGS